MSYTPVAQTDRGSGRADSPSLTSPTSQQLRRGRRASSQQSFSQPSLSPRVDNFEGMPDLSLKASQSPSWPTPQPLDSSALEYEQVRTPEEHTMDMPPNSARTRQRGNMIQEHSEGSPSHTSSSYDLVGQTTTSPLSEDGEVLEYPRTSSPEPIFRSTSNEGTANLRHPTPDLQALQGAYKHKVRKLERSAEGVKTSSDNEDDAHNIRESREHVERRQLSHRLASSSEEPPFKQRAYRQVSISSRPRSIVDVNSKARSGGNSPTAFITSPVHSIRSRQSSFNRGRSGSRGSRMVTLSEQDGGIEQAGSHPAHGDASATPRGSLKAPWETKPHEDVDVEEHAEVSRPEPEPSFSSYSLDNVPDRPGTAASVDTFQQAAQLFHDFDGIHYVAPQVTDFRVESRLGSVRRASMIPRTGGRPVSYAEPQQRENMVYYPAPVPVMLNLPQRLSKLPSPTQREKHRTQVIGALPEDSRKSAAWLPGVPEGEQDADTAEDPPRGNHQLAHLPPQLRASAFFDQPTIRHDVQLKGNSAVATLDSILDASAHAPVTAFTDHPFAGQSGADIYSKTVSQRSPSDSRNSKAHAPRSRSSLGLLLGRRRSQMDLQDNATERPPPTQRMRTVSQIGFNQSTSRLDHDEEDDDEHYESMPLRNSGEQEPLAPGPPSGSDVDPEDEDQYGNQNMDTAVADFQGAPTTLLAELQLRKQEQRHRNKTAATAFPDGMHSTLLELDAVAQRQQESRKQKRVALAWEDSDANGLDAEVDDDDDVPLGMLYPHQGNIHESRLRGNQQTRPLGLMERRALEDNEPLSLRRDRLRSGMNLDRAREALPAMYQLELPDLGKDKEKEKEKAEASDEEEETLAQRIRRLRGKGQRSKIRTVSEDFASDLLSQFGGTLGKEKESAQETDEKEETLAQRRSRLQAERGANPNGPPADNDGMTQTRPQLQQRHSMADLLQAHPAAGGRPAMRGFVSTNSIPHPPNVQQIYGVQDLHGQFQNAGKHQPRNTTSFGPEVSMSNPMFWNQVQANPGLAAAGWAGTYPMYAQGMPIMSYHQPEVSLDTRQRDMIDRWRQSVMPTM
ncbi:MAG: hypothetical protein M4579_000973 [Chaenotheca gracillima]|nr:MAG: hypothetical protein M4579_000973 [Chaenotheca gracillima]